MPGWCVLDRAPDKTRGDFVVTERGCFLSYLRADSREAAMETVQRRRPDRIIVWAFDAQELTTMAREAFFAVVAIVTGGRRRG